MLKHFEKATGKSGAPGALVGTTDFVDPGAMHPDQPRVARQGPHPYTTTPKHSLPLLSSPAGQTNSYPVAVPFRRYKCRLRPEYLPHQRYGAPDRAQRGDMSRRSVLS